MNLIFQTIMVFHFREIVQNYSRSLEIIIQIPIFYSCLIFKPVPVKWKPRGFTKPLFPFHQRSFPSRSRGSLVYNDQTIRPVSKPAKEINSNRTSFVSLIRCSNLSSSVPRCPRGQFFSFSPSSSTIFQRLFSNASLGSPIPLLHPSLHQLPLCSRAPAISYRNLSCAPKHFSENRLARAVAGQSPKC